MKVSDSIKKLIGAFADTANTIAYKSKETQKEHPLEVSSVDAKVYKVKSIDGVFMLIIYSDYVDVFYREIGPNDISPRWVPFDSDLARLMGFITAIENYEQDRR